MTISSDDDNGSHLLQLSTYPQRQEQRGHGREPELPKILVIQIREKQFREIWSRGSADVFGGP